MVQQISNAGNGGKRSSYVAHPFEALHQDLDRMLERYMPEKISNWLSEDRAMSDFASMDVIEDDTSLNIAIDVPGVASDDLEITLVGPDLVIRGKRESSSEESHEHYQHLERSFGSFVRRVELPAEVIATKVDASLEEGVLYLHLLKSAKAKPKERKIKIKTN